MKTIQVAAAIIIHNGKIFATQRGYGEFKDYWEFPGGKVEQGLYGLLSVYAEGRSDRAKGT